MKAYVPDIKSRLAAEMKTMLFVSVYLTALLGAFTLYRRLVFGIDQLRFWHYGYNLVEALVLAKVIVFGRALSLGERFRDRPLAVPTVYKTVYFGLLILVFSIMEHLVAGQLHGKSFLSAWGEMIDLGAGEILARVLVLVVALLPMFAVWETGRVLGEGRLFELFFRRGNGRPAGPQASTHSVDPELTPRDTTSIAL